MPGGDLLIHCGDMFNLNSDLEPARADLDDWFGSLDYREILCVGGNHDHALAAPLSRNERPFANAKCLVDQLHEFDGLTIYGSPWVPNLPFHAFSKDGEDLRSAWSAIPEGLDILITHTPPKGVLDTSRRGTSHGCEMLARRLDKAVPRLHCFGHVHAGAGWQENSQHRISLNASSAISGSRKLRRPVQIVVERPSVPHSAPVFSLA